MSENVEVSGMGFETVVENLRQKIVSQDFERAEEEAFLLYKNLKSVNSEKRR